MSKNKNLYYNKTMWAVIGKNGSVRALYNSKWHAKKSHRLGCDCILKHINVFIGQSEIDARKELTADNVAYHLAKYLINTKEE